MELFYYIYFFEAFISIVLCCILIKYRKPWIIGLWAGLIIANYITCYKIGMYNTETNGLDLKDTLIEMFMTMAFWVLNFVPILFGGTVLIIKISKPKFVSVIIGIITTIIVTAGVFGFNDYMLIKRPMKEQISVEEQMKEYALTYLKEKYGDDVNFEFVKIEKDYSYKGFIQQKYSGYVVTVKTDLLKDNLDITIHGKKIEDAQIKGDSFLYEYYPKVLDDYLANYNLSCDIGVKYEKGSKYGRIPTLNEMLGNKLITRIRIDDKNEDEKTKEEYVEYVKNFTINFIKNYKITNDFDFRMDKYNKEKESYDYDYTVKYSNKKITIENYRKNAKKEYYEFDISKELEEK